MAEDLPPALAALADAKRVPHEGLVLALRAGVPPELVEACLQGEILVYLYVDALVEMAALVPSDEQPRWAAYWGALGANLAVLTDQRVILKNGATPAWAVPFDQATTCTVEPQLLGGFRMTLAFDRALGGGRGSRRYVSTDVVVKNLKLGDAGTADRLRERVQGAAVRTSPSTSVGPPTAGQSPPAVPPAASDREGLPPLPYDSLTATTSTLPAEAAPATPTTTNTPTTFEVHLLGPSGAGKTVYLASLYHRMRIRRPELAFYLKSDYSSSTYLNAVYSRLSDLDAGWPESSQGLHEWEFTTVVQSTVDDYEPLRFRYLDYPGGVLTNPRAAQDPSVQDLVRRLRSASALLLLLDGEALVALMEDDPRGSRYLSFDLTSSLEIAQQSRCPLHFVITKWDLLDGRWDLDQVRDRLMEDDNFRDLVTAKMQDTRATIRLLPVSAVGLGFADADPAGGMRKTGRPLRPTNVELPLFSVLPDFLQFAHAEITARARIALDGASGAGAPADGNPVLRRLSGSALRATLVRHYPLLALIPAGVFEDAVGYGERLLRTRRARTAAGTDRHAADLMAARRDVASDRAALDLLEQQCQHLVAAFEEKYPASVLGGGIRDYEPQDVPAES